MLQNNSIVSSAFEKSQNASEIRLYTNSCNDNTLEILNDDFKI